MNILRWPRRESAEPEPTENRGYSDVVTQALVDAAAEPATDAYISALEIAAAQLSRAFAACVVRGPDAELFDPWMMAQVGRCLVELGDSVWYRTGRRLRRGENYDIAPNGVYSISLPGGVVRQPGSRVVHVRWNVDVNTERGLGPLSLARNLRVLMRRLEGSVADELNAAVGYLLPIPTDGGDNTVESLKQDIAGLKGRIAVIETTRQAWGAGPQGAPRRDYELMRVGPDIPDSSVKLYELARNTVLTACGYPIALIGDREDGTGQRESWRRYLHGTVSPLGRLLVQAARTAGLTIELDWDPLFASDISGRARAFQSLVGGGMSLQEAAAASGILMPSEDGE